jgi:phosphohistidine phosphatase
VELYFMRHGSAAGSAGSGSMRDDERPLTPEGVARSEALAGLLARTGVALDVIVASPLVRARQTAALVSGRLGAPLVVDGAAGPGFGMRALISIVKRYREAGALLFVGHEPDMSRLVAALIGGGRVHFKPGSLARVRAEWDGGDRLAGRLLWLLPPPASTTEDQAGAD